MLQYVDGLLADLVSFQPELQQLLQQLHDQAHLAAQASEAEAAKFAGKSSTANRKRTKPEPFNLTQPKPKLQPIKEPLPPPIKYAQQTVCPLCISRLASQCQCSNKEENVGLSVVRCRLDYFMHEVRY